MLNPMKLMPQIWGENLERVKPFKENVSGDIILCISDDKIDILEDVAEVARLHNGRNLISPWKGSLPYILIVGYSDSRLTKDIYNQLGEVVEYNKNHFDAEAYKSTKIVERSLRSQFQAGKFQGVDLLDKIVLADNLAAPRPGTKIYHVQDLRMEGDIPGRAMIGIFEEASAKKIDIYPKTVFIWSTFTAGRAAFARQIPTVETAEHINIIAVPKRSEGGSYGLGFLEDITKALTGNPNFPVVNAKTYRGEKVPGLCY